MTDSGISENELLDFVKSANNFTDNFHDAMLKIHINECKEYLRCAGVSENKVNSKSAVGIICRGVADFIYDGCLSAYFKERTIQMALKSEENTDV